MISGAREELIGRIGGGAENVKAGDLGLLLRCKNWESMKMLGIILLVVRSWANVGGGLISAVSIDMMPGESLCKGCEVID